MGFVMHCYPPDLITAMADVLRLFRIRLDVAGALVPQKNIGVIPSC